MRLVKDYMTKDIIAVNDSSTLKRLIQVMNLHHMCAVPVVDKMGEYIGCISESDILSSAMPSYMKSIKNTSFLANVDLVSKHLGKILNVPVGKFINIKYPIVNPDDTLSYAADLLFRSQQTVLPVVQNNYLVGLFSKLDFISVSLSSEE